MPKPKSADKGDRLDIHQTITDQIVKAVEDGAGEYRCPWHRRSGNSMRPRNAFSGKSYQGVNVISLWASADAQGFQSGKWATYRQWAEAGAQVCKGQKASLIVFYKQYEAAGEDEATETRMFARASHVFAAEQVEGYMPPSLPSGPSFDPIIEAEAYIKASGATILHGGRSAFYNRMADSITMPHRSHFVGTMTSTAQEGWYATILHELAHFTGHETRLNRQFGKRFGDQAYSFEEIVADISSAFLCSQLCITNEPRADHAQYIQHWLEILKADKTAIFHAAAKASEAVRYLDALQPVRPVSDQAAICPPNSAEPHP